MAQKKLDKLVKARKKYRDNAKSSSASGFLNPVDELEADLYSDIAEFYGDYEDVTYEDLKAKLGRANKKAKRSARADEKTSAKGLRNYRKGGLVKKSNCVNCGASMKPTQKGTKGIK
jgi:hypothetical protein